MLIQQAARTNPDIIRMSVRNVDGSGSITTGWGVAFPEAGASIDGVDAVKSTAARWQGFIGVADADIAINDWGLVISHGYAGSIQISNVGTSITVTRGDVLIPGAVAGTFFSSVTAQAISTLLYKYAYAGTTPVSVSTLAQAYCAGIVRAF